jgi:hypothetical protein
MPKLNNRPPKYSKMDKYAVVYLHGKKFYLGLYGSEESKVAYARFIAELQGESYRRSPAEWGQAGYYHGTCRRLPRSCESKHQLH